MDETEPFGAIADLLLAASARQDGRPAQALGLVRGARTTLTRYLPEGDPTLETLDEAIADLRRETAPPAQASSP